MLRIVQQVLSAFRWLGSSREVRASSPQVVTFWGLDARGTRLSTPATYSLSLPAELASPTISALRRCAFLAIAWLLAVASSWAAESLWIWGTPDANRSATTGTFQFRKTFELREPELGLVDVTCDNQYALRVNGRIAGAGSDWRQLDRYDVTELLVAGENVVEVRCINHTETAGVVLHLRVKDRGQPPQDLSSDASWQVRHVTGGRWRPRTLDGEEWKQAVELGPWGKTAPWQSAAAAKSLQVVRRQATRKEPGPLALHDGDRVVLVGNTLIERDQKFGHLETALTSRFPQHNVRFRNLGWSADTVFGHARVGFGPLSDGILHLEESVFAERPTVIVIGYGSNAAFQGEAGLADFVAGMQHLIDVFGSTGARLVLLSPIQIEDLGPPWPDPTAHNANVRLVRDALYQLAKEHNCNFVDLCADLHSSEQSPRLTENGMHLSDHGYWQAARAICENLKFRPYPWTVEVDVASQKSKSQGTTLRSLRATAQSASFSLTDNVLPTPAPKSAHGDPRVLRIRGLAPGSYQLSIDGTPIDTAAHTAWATGVSLTSGPEFTQSETLRKTINEKNLLFFRRWRPQNETYLYLFRKQEQGNNAGEVLQFDQLIADKEKQIGRLRLPVEHQYVVSPIRGDNREP